MGRDRLEREGLEGRRVCFQLSPVEQSAELSWGWFTPQKFLPYSRKVVLCFNSKQLVFIEPFFFLTCWGPDTHSFICSVFLSGIRPFSERRNRGSERLRCLAKATQLGNPTGGVHTQVSLALSTIPVTAAIALSQVPGDERDEEGAGYESK